MNKSRLNSNSRTSETKNNKIEKSEDSKIPHSSFHMWKIPELFKITDDQ